MPTLIRHGRTMLAATLCTALAACQTAPGPQAGLDETTRDRGFCEERPMICVLIGAVVIGGAVALASNSGGGDSSSSGGGGGGGGGGAVGNGGSGGTFTASDARLKTDLHFVEQLENGVNLYAFRYTGDDRVFVGVNAAEIAADPQHAHALIDLGNDFLGVDYQALGLAVVNEAEMRAAGAAAIDRASVS